MCSITGALLHNDHRTAARTFADLLRAGSKRGRDGYGYTIIERDGKRESARAPGTSAADLERANVPPTAAAILANCRAEPTTEIALRSQADVQPYESGSWLITHNGTIANDHDLRERAARAGLTHPSPIDSATIALTLARIESETPTADWLDAIREALRQIIGSYALAIAHANHPHAIALATNYKPLALFQNHDGLWFTSLESYGITRSIEERLANPVVNLPPYSLTIASETESGVSIHTERLPPYNERPRNERWLVIASAGLDSTVVASHALTLGRDVTLLHFTYGARAEVREIKAITAIAERLRVPLAILDMTTIMRDHVGGSRLTSTKHAINTEDGGAAGAELATEWVPARNLVMLALATAYAEAHSHDIIALGNNLEEAGAYPDNEMAFIDRVNDVLPYAVNANTRVQIEMPVGHLMKHEIVWLGLTLGTPFDLTWSCYEGGEHHCGTCGPCFMRRTAFERNGETDPVFAAHA